MILTFVGIASGVLTILVFLTGKPSIFHFLPIRRLQLKELFPSPYIRWRFISKDNALFLRYKSLEIAMLPDIGNMKDYRILGSSDNSKFLIIYKWIFEDNFTNIIITNFDGSNRKEHHYPSGIINAQWFNQDTYLIFLDTVSKYDYENKYPSMWKHLDATSLGLYSWDWRIKVGNYLIQLDAENEISRVLNY
jgi:hypothetical protein